MSERTPVYDFQVHHRDPHDIKIPQRQMRQHAPEKIANLKRSISHLGFYAPVSIDANGVAIIGVARIMAARELSLKSIPTLKHADLTPVQVRAIRLADNKLQEGSVWDLTNLNLELKELTAIGFDCRVPGFHTAEIDKGLANFGTFVEEEPRINLNATPVTRLGDKWIVGKHRILCGDATDRATIGLLLGNTAAAMIFMDPPYGCKIEGHVSGLGKNKHRDFVQGAGEQTPEEYALFSERFFANAFQAIEKGGLCYSCIDWRAQHVSILAALKAGFEHINTCVYVKNNGAMGSLYRSRHELVLVLKKPGGRSTNNVMLGKHGRNRTNVWEYPGASAFGASRDADLARHPTPKPLTLVADAIKDCTNRGDICVDLFGGGGTTMLAAEDTGRIAYLCELDPVYVDATLKRFQKAYDVEAVHAETGLTFSEMAKQRRAQKSGRPPRERSRCVANTMTEVA